MNATDVLQTAGILLLAIINLFNARSNKMLAEILESVMKSAMQQGGTIGKIVESQNDMLAILRQMRSRL